MLDYFGLFFVLVGTVFMMISALGVLKMPDVYLRLSATTKTSTMGVIGVLLGAACFLSGDEQLGTLSRIVAIILFVVLTSPVGAHLLGRAGYYAGTELYEHTRYDDLEGKYDVKTGVVASELTAPKDRMPPE